MMSEAVGRAQGGTAIRGALSPRGCPRLRWHGARVSSAAGCAGSLRGALPGARLGDPCTSLGLPPDPTSQKLHLNKTLYLVCMHMNV